MVTPSKWDIIPIHTSDRATFKQCRRKWFLSSPAQRNLVPKARIHGVFMPFFFGTAIHYALEKYYHPGLKEDPETTFDAFWNLQWNGGLVTEEELDRFPDQKPVEVEPGVFKVEGFAELLPDPNFEEWQKHHELGKSMMKFYKEYAEKEDSFTVISSEHTFSVPILDPKTGEAVYMPDYRQMPEGWEPSEEGNIYGPYVERRVKVDLGTNKAVEDSMFYKQVHARGRMDLIVYSENTGNYVLFDHKTDKDAITEESFAHCDTDEQCSTYLWAAEMEAKLHDLPYKEIAGIVYQILRKAAPSYPTITAHNKPSINRQTECTTAKLFEQAIKDCDLEVEFDFDEKLQSYYTYLVDLGDKQFIQRHDVTRNEYEKKSTELRVYMEAMDMLEDPRIYPAFSKNYYCTKCVFRQPCLAIERGYDYENMLTDGYELNFDR